MAHPAPLPALAGLLSFLLAAGCATAPAPEALPPATAPATAATSSPELVLISAVYGSGSNFADVTQQVIDLLHKPDAHFVARPRWLKADPTPGWNKALVIVYDFQGRRHHFTTGEGGQVSLDLLQTHAESALAEAPPSISPAPLLAPEPQSDAPLRELRVLKNIPVGRPCVTVSGFCKNPGYIGWDKDLRLAEVEAAAGFYQAPNVPFVVVRIYRHPETRWIFEDLRFSRGGHPVDPSERNPRLLPGDRVVAAEMLF